MSPQHPRQVFKRNFHTEDATFARCMSWKKRGYESKRKRQGAKALNAMNRTSKRTLLPEVNEDMILLMMAKMQYAGLGVQRRNILNKTNELKDLEAVQRFCDRHSEVLGPDSNLTLCKTLMYRLLTKEEMKKIRSVAYKEEGDEEFLLTSIQKTVQVLQSWYSKQLSAQDLVHAFDVMADVSLARVFLVIAPSPLRDLWLNQRIKKRGTSGGNNREDIEVTSFTCSNRQSIK